MYHIRKEQNFGLHINKWVDKVGKYQWKKNQPDSGTETNWQTGRR